MTVSRGAERLRALTLEGFEMKSTKTIASHVYTVIKTFRGIHGTFKQAATFANEYDAQQYPASLFRMLNQRGRFIAMGTFIFSDGPSASIAIGAE